MLGIKNGLLLPAAGASAPRGSEKSVASSSITKGNSDVILTIGGGTEKEQYLQPLINKNGVSYVL